MKSEMNEKTLFPAGPYTYSRDKDGCDDVWNIYASERDLVVTSIPFWGDDPEWARRAEATAKLFAAAPDLLRALLLADEILTLTARRGYTDFPACRDIRAAIASAGGSVTRNSDNEAKDAVRLETPRNVSNALNRVLGHFLPAEQMDFEQVDDDVARKQHIFQDLAVLNEWLRAMTGASFI